MIKSYEYCVLPDGRSVTAYEITNSYGESATILNYGATIAKLCVLDRDGKIDDVVLGIEKGGDISKNKYEASIMGRCGNRIAYGAFNIDGKDYHLKPMEGPHHLHGAEGNWAKQLFDAEVTENSVILRLADDGRDGWECKADVKLTYTFDDSHALSLEYRVTPYGNTVISPTNHAYFNLNQPNDIMNTRLKIFADKYAPKSDIHMPDGRLESVAGTPLDFREMKSFAEARENGADTFFPDYQDSFDDFYYVDGNGFRQMAEAYCEENGRILRIFSDAQTVILYTPVPTEDTEIKNGKKCKGHIAFCLETQYMPNAVNCPEYRSPIFREGETMCSRTIYSFDVK